MFKGFQTDRNISKAAGKADVVHHELQEWEHDEDHPYEPTHSLELDNQGWGSHAMFELNKKLGVKSTYTGIDNYST
jgi:hypothetical protein